MLFAFDAVNYSTNNEMDVDGAKKLVDEIRTSTRRGREHRPFQTYREIIQGSGDRLQPGVAGYDVQ